MERLFYGKIKLNQNLKKYLRMIEVYYKFQVIKMIVDLLQQHLIMGIFIYGIHKQIQKNFIQMAIQKKYYISAKSIFKNSFVFLKMVW